MKVIAKSKTMQTAAIIAVLGVAETQFHLIRDLIPAEYQGLTYVVIAALMAYLRTITTKPLSDK